LSNQEMKTHHDCCDLAEDQIS